MPQPKGRPVPRPVIVGSAVLSFVVILVGLVVSGVFSTSAPPQNATSVPASTMNAPSDNAKFLALVKSQHLLDGTADGRLVSLGQQVCRDVRTDGTAQQVIEDDIQSGQFTDPVPATQFVGQAVVVFCPQYLPEINSLVSQPAR